MIIQRDNLEQIGYPVGGSVRLSGTVLHNSAEFQAAVGRTGEHPSSANQHGRREETRPAVRGLW
jgi:hypothetical protein